MVKKGLRPFEGTNLRVRKVYKTTPDEKMDYEAGNRYAVVGDGGYFTGFPTQKEAKKWRDKYDRTPKKEPIRSRRSTPRLTRRKSLRITPKRPKLRR